MSDGDQDLVIGTGNAGGHLVYDISGGLDGNVTMCVEPWHSGLKVMVVEENCVSLLLTRQLLHQCNYDVVCCRNISEAITYVMEEEGFHGLDLILSDIFLPNEDGLILLNTIKSFQPEISVVMMSNRGDPDLAMKYIANGACVFLTKPLTLKEIENIWQHVFKSKMQNHINVENRLMLSQNNCWKRGHRSNHFSVLDVEHDENEEVIDDLRNLKKSRLHWTKQLHLQFVAAVNSLGIDKAVPRKIVEIMKVRELSREHVASHLQKYRLHLKNLKSAPSDSRSGRGTSRISNLQKSTGKKGATTNTETNFEDNVLRRNRSRVLD